jgi:hypothetical protein
VIQPQPLPEGAPLAHGGEFPDKMPQVIRVTDEEGAFLPTRVKLMSSGFIDPSLSRQSHHSSRFFTVVVITCSGGGAGVSVSNSSVSGL